MRCNKLKQLDGYVVGVLPAGNQEPNYKEFFPEDDPIFSIIDFENLRDEYGNFQYKIVENEGRNFVTLEPQQPNEEQIKKVEKKDKTKVIRKEYKLEEELEMIRKIIIASSLTIPEECKPYIDFITKIIKEKE
jgi:hypothetical protein